MSWLRAGTLLILVSWLGSAGCSDTANGADGANGANAPAVESSAPLAVGVRVRGVVVQSGVVTARDEVSGIVRAFHKAEINAETEGRVTSRLVERGDVVKQDQPLFELDASRLALEVRRSASTVKARETDLAHARRELARAEKLIARGAISAQQRDDLEYGVASAVDGLDLARVARDTARRALADATVRAPFDGVVEETSVDTGDFVAPGTPVASLVELSRMKLRAGVTAAETAHLEVGQRAQARFAAFGGRSVDAELMSIGWVADEADGTYPVEFWIDNPDHRLRDGMLGNITLPRPDESVARPLVPRAALMRHNGGMGIFVAEGAAPNHRAVMRGIDVGRSEGDWVEVLAGVEAGEVAIVEGQFALLDGGAVVVEMDRTTRRKDEVSLADDAP